MVLTLQQKQAKLKAELAKISQKITKEDRKTDARRKILLGAFMLTKYKDPANELAGFAEYLVKDLDREVFGLEPLPKPETVEKSQVQS